MAHRKPNPPRHQHGFVKIKAIRCPDCEVEGHLRNDGGAIVVQGAGLRPVTREAGIVTAASGCPTCKGRGSIRTTDIKRLMEAGIEHPRLAEFDPYALHVRDAIERRTKRRVAPGR